MSDAGDLALVTGGVLTAGAAVAHLACIVIGPKAYRFMGAGERMARAAEAGKARPPLITLAISVVLIVWALYAFSGAGIVGPLPLTGIALPAISVVYLVRAFGFALLKPVIPENSATFWYVSSAICLALGSVYAVGAMEYWRR